MEYNMVMQYIYTVFKNQIRIVNISISLYIYKEIYTSISLYIFMGYSVIRP
jgi:hypothetical protein